jgi:hypothetical protein
MAGLIEDMYAAYAHHEIGAGGVGGVGLDDVIALLRSDETREALAEAIFQVVVDGPQPDGGIPSHMLADAVIRVLTGEEGDRG